jgi:hypothetical protein
MTDEGTEANALAKDAQSHPGPLVFISHDSRDADLAEAFSKLLGSVSAGMLKSFRSSDRKGAQGFEYGVEWYPELMGRLGSACDVVCLLTERSLDRPWILYEAGVAKGRLSIPVHGLALGVPLARANTGPFAQFQNCDDDLGSLTKLVIQLVRRLPNADPDKEAVQSQVEAFKGKISTILSASTPMPEDDSARYNEASVAKLFEEIKIMFQDLPARVDQRSTSSLYDKRRRDRLSPTMLLEFTHGMGRGDRVAPLGALIISSFLRDDAPWIYELGREYFHAASSLDSKRQDRALAEFTRALDMLDGPISPFVRRDPELRMASHEYVILFNRLVRMDERRTSPEPVSSEEASPSE